MMKGKVKVKVKAKPALLVQKCSFRFNECDVSVFDSVSIFVVDFD